MIRRYPRGMKRSLLNYFVMAAVAAFSFVEFAASKDSAGALTADESKLCADLSLTSRPWATVRWEVSLTEARERAEREGKPIFLVVNTGNVLGFV